MKLIGVYNLQMEIATGIATIIIAICILGLTASLAILLISKIKQTLNKKNKKEKK